MRFLWRKKQPAMVPGKMSHSGFSLMEVLTVLVIIGILTFAGISFYTDYTNKQRAKNCLYKTFFLIKQVQTEAKVRKVPYEITFNGSQVVVKPKGEEPNIYITECDFNTTKIGISKFGLFNTEGITITNKKAPEGVPKHLFISPVLVSIY